MIFRNHIPEPPLSDFVEVMWLTEGYIQPHRLERVLPTGAMSLIINLHEDCNRVYDRHIHSKYQRLSGSIICGASSEFAIIDTVEQQSTVGVAFRPGGAFPFFKQSAGELQDADVSLDALWGAGASYLREQLLEGKTSRAKFQILEAALLGRIVELLEPHPAVRYAVNNFQRLPHRAVSAVTDQIGLSERRFIQVFAEQVGLTPKLFCRVQRFQSVLRHMSGHLAPGHCIDWAQIALECGYFDQAHFNHDFRAFSGINPTSYLANKTQFQNHVVLQD
jgi:AraC-like DNA-binding protein